MIEPVRKTRKVQIRTVSWLGSTIPVLPEAACKTHPNPSLWDFEMDDDGIERPDQRAGRHAKAKKICSGCPEQVSCFMWAVDNDVVGVWGREIFVPPGIAYHRCRTCGIGLIRSRYRIPPEGLANPGVKGYCRDCTRKMGLDLTEELEAG